MCGDSSKTTIGGTIAILKAVDETPDISLLFNTPTLDSASTTATFQSSSTSSHTQKEFERCQIIIHRSGDLRSMHTDPQDILHSFPLAPTAYKSRKDSESGTDSFQLPTRLHLGVGEDGVIGRRVSLVRRTAMGAKVVRVGIIGWN